MNENRCVCCDASIPEGKQICPKCEKGVDERPKKNIDRIREMTVEELAKFLLYPKKELTDFIRNKKSCIKCSNKRSCANCYKEWLESEVNNE